jgi:hypothetical protein
MGIEVTKCTRTLRLKVKSEAYGWLNAGATECFERIGSETIERVNAEFATRRALRDILVPHARRHLTGATISSRKRARRGSLSPSRMPTARGSSSGGSTLVRRALYEISQEDLR